MYNRLRHNRHFDDWASVCVHDANGDGGDDYPGLPETFAINIGDQANSTVRHRRDAIHATEILKLPIAYGGPAGFGGPGAIISLGPDGYMIVAVKPALTNPGVAGETDRVVCSGRFPPPASAVPVLLRCS